jgi:hypothetical protein
LFFVPDRFFLDSDNKAPEDGFFCFHLSRPILNPSSPQGHIQTAPPLMAPTTLPAALRLFTLRVPGSLCGITNALEDVFFLFSGGSFFNPSQQHQIQRAPPPTPPPTSPYI